MLGACAVAAQSVAAAAQSATVPAIQLRGEHREPGRSIVQCPCSRSIACVGGIGLIHERAERRDRCRRMAAVPFFIQSPDSGRYCHSDPHQVDSQHHQRKPTAKSEPRVDEDLRPLLELHDAAVRQTLNHDDMIAADRDPVCPSVDVQNFPSLYRSSTGAAIDARTPNYLGHDGYYRNVSDFTSYQYPPSLIARPFGNGYCRSAYADKCARRYPIEPESYFHPGSAWARLPVGGAFPFPVPQEFGAVNSGRHEYQTAVATSGDCCRTDLVAERSYPVTANVGCSQTAVDGGPSSGHRRRSTVSDRSPPLRTSATSNSCCRRDSTDGNTERDHLVPTTSDDTTTSTSSKSTTLSTTTTTTSVVVYPWMRKLHSRANTSVGKSALCSPCLLLQRPKT